MIKNDWCRCPFCSHKLFRFCGKVFGIIEIKCPSCKKIFKIDLQEGERIEI